MRAAIFRNGEIVVDRVRPVTAGIEKKGAARVLVNGLSRNRPAQADGAGKPHGLLHPVKPLLR